jgi:hypothetical protein
LLAVLAEKADPSGESRARERDQGKALAGKSTLNRLEWTGEVVCVQRRLACSVGGSPTGVGVRNPVAWVASAEETKRREPTDKAILGVVSESLGRNV